MGPTTLFATLAGGAAVLVWRIRETQRPVTAAKILIPPLGMTTGFSMFVVPQTRVPFTWGLTAFLVGALFLSYPLIHTSALTRGAGDVVILKPSRSSPSGSPRGATSSSTSTPSRPGRSSSCSRTGCSSHGES